MIDKMLFGEYTCFTCLQSSNNPSVCSHCGAKIESLDPERAVIKVPQIGQYVVTYSDFPSQHVQAALGEVRTAYFQTIEVVDLSEGVQIRSNTLAYQKFIEILSAKMGALIDDLKMSIHFQED